MNSGLKAVPGVSEAASAAACAKRFDGPMTKVSKVNFGFRWVGPASVGEVTRAGRGGGGGSGWLLLFLIVSGDELQGGINRDGDAHGASEVHGQGGRQLRLGFVFDPLLGEAVGDGQQDRALDVAEWARRAQHRRGDGSQLVGGDCIEGGSPRTCEGIRLHGNLRTK